MVLLTVFIIISLENNFNYVTTRQLHFLKILGINNQLISTKITTDKFHLPSGNLVIVYKCAIRADQ